MSKCVLKIVLDHPNRTYAAGEKVAGTVEVNATDDCACRKLTLLHVWRTHSQGDEDFGKPKEQVLFTGDWRAGQRASYPFEFTAPPGPVSYRGASFSVDWYLRAQADIAGALDASADEQFVLMRGESQETFNLGPAFRCTDSQQQLVQLGQAIGQGCLVLTGFCFLLISIPFFLSVRDALRRAVPFGPQEWSILIVIVPFAAFAVGLIVWGFRPLIARVKLGPVGVQITPAIVRPGESVTCAISFRPRGDIDLVEAAATLKNLEVVERSGSERDRHYRNVIFEQRTAIATGRRLMGGESVTLTGNMQVPPNAATTFMAAHNSGMWLINVHLKLSGWPDWSHDFTLVVRP